MLINNPANFKNFKDNIKNKNIEIIRDMICISANEKIQALWDKKSYNNYYGICLLYEKAISEKGTNKSGKDGKDDSVLLDNFFKILIDSIKEENCIYYKNVLENKYDKIYPLYLGILKNQDNIMNYNSINEINIKDIKAIKYLNNKISNMDILNIFDDNFLIKIWLPIGISSSNYEYQMINIISNITGLNTVNIYKEYDDFLVKYNVNVNDITTPVSFLYFLHFYLERKNKPNIENNMHTKIKR